MRIVRNHRRRLSAGLVLVMLLMQFATAAFACQREVQALQVMAASTEQSVMADMPGCQMSVAKPAISVSANPALCHAHCNQGSQASATPPALDPPSTTGFIVDLPEPALLSVAVATQRTTLPHSGPPPGWPPAYLAFLVLRN